jgi:O-6-methylguanine DNA methyltransferase
MAAQNKYVVFETEWGYAGFLGGEKAVKRLILPQKQAKKVRRNLLAFCGDALFDGEYMPDLRERIIAYFAGFSVDFGKVRVDPGRLSIFCGKIVSACRRIPFGGTLSYSQLAAAAGYPRAARAAGSVMAKNPLPLIIPCHRVICSDGGAGEFSACGGAAFKRRLLALEAGNGLSHQAHPPKTAALTNTVAV